MTLAIMTADSATAFTQPYYVSTIGSDSNSGTLSSPFRTVVKAISVVREGETIYIRGSMTLYNCTDNGNQVANYRIKTELAAGKVLTLKNCAELGGTVELGSFAVQEKNSWLSPFVVTADDFRSLDYAGADGPRKADGSLPHIEYMHLAQGSDLIDAGVILGMPYVGSASDLGCFETGLTGVSLLHAPGSATFFPNPVSTTGYILLEAEAGHCEVHIHDVTGKFVKRVAERDIEPGESILTVDLSGMHDGVYICRVLLNGKPLCTLRIMKISADR